MKKTKTKKQFKEFCEKYKVTPVSGEEIRMLRDKYNLSQEQLGQFLGGYTRFTISAFESSKKTANNIKLARLIHHMKIQMKNKS